MRVNVAQSNTDDTTCLLIPSMGISGGGEQGAGVGVAVGESTLMNHS